MLPESKGLHREQPWSCKRLHSYSLVPHLALHHTVISEDFWSDTAPPSSHKGRAPT